MLGSKRFEGKTAFITGAASGIGRATAVGFAAEGARVVVTDRGEAALQETAERVKAAGAEVLATTWAGPKCSRSPVMCRSRKKSRRHSHRQSKPSAASTARSTTPASRTRQRRFTK